MFFLGYAVGINGQPQEPLFKGRLAESLVRGALIGLRRGLEQGHEPSEIESYLVFEKENGERFYKVLFQSEVQPKNPGYKSRDHCGYGL